MKARPKILCVDQDTATLELCRQILASRYDVYLARGGAQALEKMELGPDYDLILAAKDLGDLGGIGLLRYAVMDKPGTATLLMADVGELDSVVEDLSAGEMDIDHLVMTPCPSWKLSLAVDRAVAAPSATPQEARVVEPNSFRLRFKAAEEWVRYATAFAVAA